MTRTDLHTHMETTFRDCLEIAKAKNADYASDADPFTNFRLTEHLGLCDVPTGIMVRMADKVSRIANLLTAEAQVKDESVEDTLKDLINYSAILLGYLETARDE